MAEDKNTVQEENEELKNKYLVFDVDERYALELKTVLEIIEYHEVSSVPETPPYIVGVINLRGRVIPVIDLRMRFKKPAATQSIRKCIIVVNFESTLLGLIVDNVVDLISIEPDKVAPPPKVGDNYAHVFIKQIGVLDGQMVLIVDSDKLVNLNDLEIINEQA